MLRALHHTGFTVSDMERSLAFYRDLLGLEVVVDQEPEAEYPAQVTGFPGARLRIVFLKLPLILGGDATTGGEPRFHEHILELIQYKVRHGGPLPLATNRPGCSHLCFQVNDLPALYARWRERGVPFVSPPVPITQGVNQGGYAVYARDPDGITIELLQRPEARRG